MAFKGGFINNSSVTFFTKDIKVVKISARRIWSNVFYEVVNIGYCNVFCCALCCRCCWHFMRGGLAKHVFDRSLLMALLFYELTTSSTKHLMLSLSCKKNTRKKRSEYWITVFPHSVWVHTSINRCILHKNTIALHCVF